MDRQDYVATTITDPKPLASLVPQPMLRREPFSRWEWERAQPLTVAQIKKMGIANITPFQHLLCQPVYLLVPSTNERLFVHFNSSISRVYIKPYPDIPSRSLKNPISGLLIRSVPPKTTNMAEPQAPPDANGHYRNTDNEDLLFQKDEILVINVLGGPGVGKGTQCERLAQEFGISHLSVGDLLREEKNRPGSASSNLIEQTLQQGTLVPAELAVTVLRNAILQETRKGTKIFLVDGFPRNMDQALHFESTICKSRVTLFFDGSREVMLGRVLKRGTYSQRIDDNEEAFEKRWQGFNSDTMPVIEYFNTKDKVVTIDCNGPLETGYFDVKRVVESYMH